MTKQKSTKRALLLSALSLLLCVSMLIGSTFAWFTDSATSAGNKIQSGKLVLDLELMDKQTGNWSSIKESKAPIFTHDKWEPGYTDVKILKVENEGNLALKWEAKFVTDQTPLSPLANVIDVYVRPYGVLEDAASVTYPAGRNLDGYTRVGTVSEFVNTIRKTTWGNLEPGAEAYLGIALKMQESAGNEYQDKQLGLFDIQIVATQLTYEKDSFDDQYDVDAKFPLGKNSRTSVVYEDIGFAAKVDIPAEAPEGEYDLSAPKDQVVIKNDDGTASVSFEMDLLYTVDGTTEKVEESSMAWPVTIQLPQDHSLIKVEEVWHNDNKIEDFKYDPETNTVSFTTTHFSPFEIKYVDYVDPSFALDYVRNGDDITITRGLFVNKNPADLDPSLNEPGSEYVVVDFAKGDTKYYLVSERDSTIILGDADNAGTTYTFENAYCPAPTMINDDLLYKYLDDKVEGAEAVVNDGLYDTVCILPGTYDGQNTLTVARDMDIVGLGNADDIIVKKIGIHNDNTTKPSERHLFNINGAATLSEHIRVTIRNLHLDATESNSYKTNTIIGRATEDNAAVQSIRMSKVKCYDLTITDGNNASPFYVNGHYAAAGAYMYVENCAATNNVPMIQFHCAADKELFYYNNFTHKNGVAFSSTDKKAKNTTMAVDDWIWD